MSWCPRPVRRPQVALFGATLGVILLTSAGWNSVARPAASGAPTAETIAASATSPGSSITRRVPGSRWSRPVAGAITAAQTATRHYAKRQVTWFRHQLIGSRPGGPAHACHVLTEQYSESLREKMFTIVCDCG